MRPLSFWRIWGVALLIVVAVCGGLGAVVNV